jgi:penicillin-binding protein 1A
MSGTTRRKRSQNPKPTATKTKGRAIEDTQPMQKLVLPAKKKPARKRRKGLLRWYDTVLKAVDSRVDEEGNKPHAIFTVRTKPPNFVLSVIVTSFRLLIVVFLILGFLAGGALFGVARAYINTAPDLNLNVFAETALASQIYDQEGNYITSYSGTQNRLWAAYREIPKDLINAIVATEDARFFSHGGVDIKRIVGSLIGNFTSSTVQGGSTITQQLIKNRMLTSERSYRRKIQEAYLAYQLEKEYTKEQILEAYLNDVNLSQGNYGVKSAAHDYFGKELDELTLRDCAMLAGMVNSPNTYDPRRNYFVRNRPELTDNRTDTVLSRMYREGYITFEQYNAALAEKVGINKERTNTALSVAPSFVDYVIYDVINHFLVARNLTDTQENRNAIDYELRTSGYHIYTTLDTQVQNAAETATYNYTNYPKMKNPSDATTTFVNSDGTTTVTDQPQAAVVVVDFRTGQVKAMVGGRSEPTGLKVLNRAYMSHQPVGSSIKPLSVYGPAIDTMGLGAGSVIANLEGEVLGWSTDKTWPYAGKTLAPVTMRTAIIESLNLSAARVLMEMSGENSIATSALYLQKLGIDMRYVRATPAGLALGSSGISPLDEAVAYAAIANKGLYISPISFTKVEDGSHRIILDGVAMQHTVQVYKPGTAWLLVDMLTDAVKSGTGTKAKVTGVTVAGKTGTNDNYRGVTFAGITPHYTAAIYIGHDNYKALQNGAAGGTFAAPLFSRIMTSVYDKKNLANGRIIAESPESLGLVKATVCPVSGQLVTDACAHDMGGLLPVTDWFPASGVPTTECTMHITADICTESNKLATPYCTSVTQKAYVLVSPQSVFARCDLSKFPWFFIGESPVTGLSHPDAFCNIHTAAGARTAAIAAANAALHRAVTRIEPYLTSLSSERVTEYTGKVDTLQRLVNEPNSTVVALTQATNALNNLIDELLALLGQT